LNADAEETYDTAGRLLTLQQAGTTLNSFTYHDPATSDTSQYLIARTSLDSSTNQVLVHRFDALNRPSLTQELETAEPGNIGSDLTSGIKTARQYAWSASLAGYFEMVSKSLPGFV
jgi:hypothetical protein